MADLEPKLGRCGIADLHVRQSVSSTNDWAIAAADLPQTRTPALFYARSQTHGRGRGRNTWHSAPGSLTWTLLVERPIPLTDPRTGLISLATAVGLCHYLESDWGLIPRIKWPNDIYLEDRKLAGILIESAARGRLVVGCGMNVSNPVDLLPGAISLGECTGELPGLDDVLAGTAQQVLRAFEELRESPQKIVQYCRDRDWLAGRTVLWSGMESDSPALARGITEEGKLILRISGESVDRQIGTGSLTVLSETDRPESRMEY